MHWKKSIAIITDLLWGLRLGRLGEHSWENPYHATMLSQLVS